MMTMMNQSPLVFFDALAAKQQQILKTHESSASLLPVGSIQLKSCSDRWLNQQSVSKRPTKYHLPMPRRAPTPYPDQTTNLPTMSSRFRQIPPTLVLRKHTKYANLSEKSKQTTDSWETQAARLPVDSTLVHHTLYSVGVNKANKKNCWLELGLTGSLLSSRHFCNLGLRQNPNTQCNFAQQNSNNSSRKHTFFVLWAMHLVCVFCLFSSHRRL